MSSSNLIRLPLLLALALAATAALAGGAGGAHVTTKAILSGYATNNGFPAYSPDGTRIAFTSAREGRNREHIFVMNVDGSHVRRVTSGKTRDFMPAWSPDGTKIAFTGVNADSTYIDVVNATG